MVVVFDCVEDLWKVYLIGGGAIMEMWQGKTAGSMNGFSTKV